MMVSTKGRYALRVMIDLAQHDSEAPVPLKAISARQHISQKYLEAIVAMLNRGKLVHSQRGTAGGYRLARPAAEITVAEVMRMTEGSMAPVACLDGSGEAMCAHADACLTLPMWAGLDQLIDRYLRSISIADLTARRVPTPHFAEK